MPKKITEETLEQEIAKYLQEELPGSFTTQEQISGSRGKVDIFWRTKDFSIVIEGKVSSQTGLIYDAVKQAREYQDQTDADGIIVLVYPPLIRQFEAEQVEVRNLALNTPLTTQWVDTPFIKDLGEKATLAELVSKIKKHLEKPDATPAIAMVVRMLADSVRALCQVLKRQQGISEKVAEEVVGNFRLFSALADAQGKEDSETMEKVRSVAADLACYILTNQILLHRLLTKPLNLTPLSRVKSLEELAAAFEEIRRIDYRAIYNIAVAAKFPEETLSVVNEVIREINKVEPERVPHDLLGRVFHELLPFETRKQLGAFYTKPVAAEILAQIGIQKDAYSVLDPACGSGTLLVAAYRRLRKLHPELTHRKLVEELITGVDLMPFAAHMTALNLTLQSIEETTDRTRVGLYNSLQLSRTSRVPVIGRTGLLDFELYIEGVGPDITSESLPFEMPDSVDVVIMNPPFTRRERVKGTMHGNYGGVFTQHQNYWAYFLPLADSLLRTNGLIAAVLPRDVIRGDWSTAVRKWLFETAGYSLLYVVKSMREVAFSENAAFRDYLLVFKKGRADACAVVYLKRSLSNMDTSSASKIGAQIANVPENFSVDTEDYAVDWLQQELVLKNSADLWPLVAFVNPSNAKSLNALYSRVLQSHPDLCKLADVTEMMEKKLRRGIEPKPTGMYEKTFIVRAITDKRIARSRLALANESSKSISAILDVSGKTLRLARSNVVKGLKTHSYLPRINVTADCDYLIVNASPRYKEIEKAIGGEPVDFSYIQRAASTHKCNLVVVRCTIRIHW